MGALLSARRAAVAALRQWRTKREFADAIIAKTLEESKLTSADRAYALDLFYGVLRNLTLLDSWIGGLRRLNLDVDLRDIVRLGLYQLLLAETSDHAAVYETVELTPKKQRAVINGILRSAIRRRGDLWDQAKAQPLDVRTSHPRFLVERWQENIGPTETEALCLWNNQPPPIYARINRLKIDRDTFLKTYPAAQSLPDNSDFVEFRPLQREALSRGHCYVQDPSTGLACRILGPRSGEKILDACAAPGGKTSYLAQMMQNQGLILACDRNPNRLELLEENVARLGTKIVRTVCHDWNRDKVPAEIMDLAPFDRILIDAPCSNTGVMRRRVDLRWRLKPVDFIKMPKEQMSILRNVIPLLKPEGIIVYSTCSLEPEENELLLLQAVRDFPALSSIEQESVLPFRDGFDGAFAAKLLQGERLHPVRPMES